VAALLRELVARFGRLGGAHALQLEARTASTRLGWDAPATTVTLAGVHGGSGTTTLCLLLAQAIASFGEAPALAVDLAGRSRGGLAVLGAACGQTTVEGTAAVAAVHGGRLERPFGVTEGGVRVIGTYPDGVEELDRSHESLVARLVGAIDAGTDDARLAQLMRMAVREDRSLQALRWDSDQAADAVECLLDQAAPHHALVAVDLGMLDSERLAQVTGKRSPLHVWVVPGRPYSLEVAERRLPQVPLEPAGAEAIAVWANDGFAPSSKRLSALGDLRGCPVVRVANHAGARGWPARLHRCLSGITDLCELAR
jgi:hypothetical protein